MLPACPAEAFRTTEPLSVLCALNPTATATATATAMNFPLSLSQASPRHLFTTAALGLEVDHFLKMSDTRAEQIDFCTLGMFIIGG